MDKIERSKVSYIFDGVTGDVLPADMVKIINSYVESAKTNLTDIAGVRIICSYIDDIYLIADLLTSQDDIEVIRRTDYIKNPKPNGYRSLHLIVTVPVFLSDRTELVKVEVQIRTIAMDFWASLEHELTYKLTGKKTKAVLKELKECADVIAETDNRM
jgi:putative GTP pyrophosphokinase